MHHARHTELSKKMRDRYCRVPIVTSEIIGVFQIRSSNSVLSSSQTTERLFRCFPDKAEFRARRILSTEETRLLHHPLNCTGNRQYQTFEQTLIQIFSYRLWSTRVHLNFSCRATDFAVERWRHGNTMLRFHNSYGWHSTLGLYVSSYGTTTKKSEKKREMRLS